MGQDLCIDFDGGVVNIRVGAIIMKDGKFLMAGRPARLCDGGFLLR